MEKNQNLRDQINSYSDFFKIAGVDEKDYTVQEDSTWAEKAATQLKRLKVSQKVLNKGVKVVRANIKQWKHWPYFHIIPTAGALAGLRLSYSDFGIAFAYSTLGARPEYLDENDAIWMGKTFLTEFELLVQYQAMADEEE